MPDLTPAAELRAASARLKSLATAAEPDLAVLRGVPWETESCDAGCQCIVSQTQPGSADMARPGRYIADAETPALADWIALMDPAVGLLLADWLEYASTRYDPAADIQVTDRSHELPIAVARAINTPTEERA